MGDREVYEEPDVQCDVCGEYGAFDFYGDAICQKCIDENKSKSRVRRKAAQKKPFETAGERGSVAGTRLRKKTS